MLKENCERLRILLTDQFEMDKVFVIFAINGKYRGS